LGNWLECLLAIGQLAGMFTGCGATGWNVYWLQGNWAECLLAVGQRAGIFTGCRANGWKVYWL